MLEIKKGKYIIIAAMHLVRTYYSSDTITTTTTNSNEQVFGSQVPGIV